MVSKTRFAKKEQRKSEKHRINPFLVSIGRTDNSNITDTRDLCKRHFNCEPEKINQKKKKGYISYNINNRHCPPHCKFCNLSPWRTIKYERSVNFFPRNDQYRRNVLELQKNSELVKKRWYFTAPEDRMKCTKTHLQEIN